MSWRSWVDDCTTGILNDCYSDNPKKKVLTETGAAFKNYNRMMGLQENYMNMREISWNKYLILISLLILIVLFIVICLAKKKSS